MGVRSDTKEVSVVRSQGAGPERDTVVVEAPLEIRVDGQALAVLMRTPGHDKALCAGFLLTEGVIELADDLTQLAPCTDPNRPHAQNTYLAQLAPGCPDIAERLSAAQRNVYASSSCGLCGKATIESIHQKVRPHPQFRPIPRALLERIDAHVRPLQPCFALTGGSHAAVALSLDEELSVLASAEDVGRHNAVDKVIGTLLLEERTPADGALLWVSGRASFEMVQKALMAGFRALVCVGAPTSLAVEMAEASRLSLIGFASGPKRYNLYCGELVGE